MNMTEGDIVKSYKEAKHYVNTRVRSQGNNADRRNARTDMFAGK